MQTLYVASISLKFCHDNVIFQGLPGTPGGQGPDGPVGKPVSIVLLSVYVSWFVPLPECSIRVI